MQIVMMPGLRSLHVALHDHNSIYLDEQLLEQLMACKAKDFAADPPWYAKEGKTYEEKPFRIVRPKPGEDKRYCDEAFNFSSDRKDSCK